MPPRLRWPWFRDETSDRMGSLLKFSRFIPRLTNNFVSAIMSLLLRQILVFGLQHMMNIDLSTSTFSDSFDSFSVFLDNTLSTFFLDINVVVYVAQ